MFRRGALPWALTLLCLLAAGTPVVRAAGAADDDDDGPAPRSGAAAAHRKEGYAIRLHRPMKAGQSYAWSADSTVINTLPVIPTGGATPNAAAAAPATVTDTVSVHLDAVVQILNVDRNGGVTEMACTVQECVARTAKERRTVVQPGRTILVEAGKWKPKLTATSGNFTIQDDVLLRSVLPLPRVDDTTDDDVYGTAKKQAVGESWNVRPDQVLRSWAAAGYKLKAQHVSGTVKLKSAEMVDGVECLRVSGRTKIEHFLPPALDIPQGIDIGDATTELKFTRLLPEDPSKQVLQDSHSLTVHFVLKKDPRALTPEAREGKLLRSVGVKLKLLSQ
jgi:hypothetical protein